jgi:two-component system CheB/CheR fusion protein
LFLKKNEFRNSKYIIDSRIERKIRKIKILVVEDITLNQLLLKIILEEFGFEQDFAENGKSGH